MICQADKCDNDAYYAIQDKMNLTTNSFNFKYLCVDCYDELKRNK